MGTVIEVKDEDSGRLGVSVVYGPGDRVVGSFCCLLETCVSEGAGFRLLPKIDIESDVCPIGGLEERAVGYAEEM